VGSALPLLVPKRGVVGASVSYRPAIRGRLSDLTQMSPLPVLILALATTVAPCSPQLGGHPHYMVSGALRDLSFHDQLTLDAYVPAGEPRPAALIIHGSHGNKSTHITQLFDVLDRAGVAWFSVEYHSAEDVSDAVQYIRCPGRFNISSEMVLIGEDTGAEIALSLAARSEFAGVVVFGAKLREANFKEKNGNPKNRPLPMVLMFHGTADEEAPAAVAEAICKQLSHCTFHAIAGGIHNFENWHPDQWDWKDDLIAWLRHDRRGLWKDIVYSRTDGRELLMDAFIPDTGGLLPAVIIVHGGGWEAGNKVTYISPLFRPLAEGGFAWFSIDYRLTPYAHIPEELDDVRTAIRYVRAHADRFHVDRDRIALLGESASGQLVTQVASKPCLGCEVQAVVSFYGVFDFTAWSPDSVEEKAALKRLFGDWTTPMLERYSPMFNSRPDQPPILLVQGTQDELYRGTMDYTSKLKMVGAPFELILLEGAPHGMENWEGHAEWMFYKQKLVEWLRAKLRVP
jgi:acetyl esterase